MKDKDQDHSFTRKTGTGMIIAGWLLFGVLMVSVFGKLLDWQHNPNSNVATVYTGEQREVVLQRNKFGHYVASGQINGQEVVFLVDTGATDVAIPERTANRLGLEKGYAHKARTANGLTTVYDTRLASVSLGDITLNNVDASILANSGTHEILLGMAFLKKLELVQKGDQLTLRQ